MNLGLRRGGGAVGLVAQFPAPLKDRWSGPVVG